MPSSNIQVTRICRHISCKREYVASTIKSKFCSKRCYKADWARRKRAKQKSSKRLKSTEARIKDKITNQTYFTVADICAFTGACRKTIYRAIEEYKDSEGASGLKAKKFGRAYIITRENFDHYLNQV